MTNVEKAMEIADRMIDMPNESSYNTPDEQRNNIRNIAEQAALKMAEWKEQQLKKVCSKCEKYIAQHGEMCWWRFAEQNYCWRGIIMTNELKKHEKEDN